MIGDSDLIEFYIISPFVEGKTGISCQTFHKPLALNRQWNVNLV